MVGASKIDTAMITYGYGITILGEPLLLSQREGQSIFRLDTTDGQVLIWRRVPSVRTNEQVRGETEVLSYLEQQGFPAPRLRPTLGGSPVLFSRAGNLGYAQSFIQGQPFQWNLTTLQDVGQGLGRLHNLPLPAKPALPTVYWLDEQATVVAQAESCTSDPIWGSRAAEIAEAIRSVPRLYDLPAGLIHSDVHEGNLLYGSSGQLYWLDWELAGKGQFLLDVALMLGWHCFWPATKGSLEQAEFEPDEQWCKSFLTAYQRVRPLTPQEIKHLTAAIRFVVGYYAVRDILLEIETPGTSKGLAFFHWAIVHNLTPTREKLLEQWVVETA